MTVLFVVDGGSHIARNWIQEVVAWGWEVHVVSTVPAPPPIEGVKSTVSLPIGLSRLRTESLRPGAAKNRNPLAARVSRVLRAVQQRMPEQVLFSLASKSAARDVSGKSNELREIIRRVKPDLVHAMRIPYEGIFASEALTETPLIISVWGNDFTLHAARSPLTAKLTRNAMKNVTALHADCARDLRLARDFGFDENKPQILVPGSGGVQRTMFHPGPLSPAELAELDIPSDRRIVVHPRGFRAYVRNEIFFPAFADVVKRHPEVLLVCPGMAGVSTVESMVQSLGLQNHVRLLPVQPRAQMAKIFRASEIMVSPSEFDGTPNTLLEAMACGCFPVVGDIDSVREWIVDHENGLIHGARDQMGMASTLTEALESAPLRQSALEKNQQIIEERATYEKSMQRAKDFYAQVSGQRK